MSKSGLLPAKYGKLLNKGLIMWLKRDDIEAAKDVFEEFLTMLKRDNIHYSEEKSAPVISMLAFCYIHLKNYDKGFANLYKILEFNPKFELAHRTIFYIFDKTIMLHEKKYEDRETTEALKPIIKTFQDEDSFASNLLLAVLYWMEKNHDEMFLHLKKVEKLTPDNVYLPYYFAEYHRLKREFDEAIKDFGIFLESKPEVKNAYTSTVECFYEKSFDLLRQGKYEDAKLCLDNGIDIAKNFRGMPQIKKDKHNPAQFFLQIIEEEMDIFKKFILFDYQFERIFIAGSLDELCKTTLMSFEYLQSLGIFPPKRYILSETARKLFFKKTHCLGIILNALSFFKKMSKAEAEEWLVEARQFFLKENFIFGKQAVDSVETFITALAQYKNFEEIPKEKETELISLLRPAYVLARDLTLFAAERQKSDLSLRKELISSVREEIKKGLKIRTIAGKPKEKEPEVEKAEYDTWLFKCRKPDLPYSYVNKHFLEKVRDYDLLVDETKGQIFFGRISGEIEVKEILKSGKEVSLIRGYPFEVLIRFLKRDGNAGTAEQIFGNVWGYGNLVNEKSYRNRIEQAITDLRDKLKKVVDIECSNRRYKFSKRIKYCLIKERENLPQQTGPL